MKIGSTLTRAFLLFALVATLPAFGQSTVTLTPSITSGDGSFSIPTMTWATNPALTTGTPCTASAVPASSLWTGAKAGSGTVTNLGPFSANTRLNLVCQFQGDSIVTFTWTNATQNTDGTPYNNPKAVVIKHTFNPTITSSPTASSGEQVVTVADTSAARATMRTVTGIAQTGTLRALAFHQNQNDAYSAASNAVTKQFTGSFNVTASVDITVRAVPNALTNFQAQ